MSETLPPLEHLALRMLAMPRDANPTGDIFGGWLVSLMDMAGSIVATQRSKGRVVLAAIHQMSFLRPVAVGDEISCYAHIVKTGTTSLQVSIEAWVRRPQDGYTHKVTEGLFIFVGIDEAHKPRPLPNT